MPTRILAAVCLAAVLAQEPSQLPPPFRTGVDLVEVDVAVLDRERRPVRGLTAADFTLLENGQAQEIVAFHEVHVGQPDRAAAAWAREVAPDVRTNEPPAGRLLFALSGIVLTAAPAPPAGPRDILTPLLPVVPTTRRGFGGTDAVTAFARVYQGGRSPTLSTELAVTILDAAGREVFRRTDTLRPEWFAAGRAADYQVELPVARLSPGPHVLTIEAAARRETARGTVRFTIE